MRTIYQKLPLKEGHSFVARTYRTPHFETPWHQHDEIELLLCTGCPGTSFIGDYIGAYQKGEVYLLGKNLPHWFKKGDESKIGEALVIQFNASLFGDSLDSLPEFGSIRNILIVSSRGIRLRSGLNTSVRKRLEKTERQPPFERYLNLLSCLYDISISQEYDILSNMNLESISHTEFERISKVYEYSFENFKTNITLQQMADLTNQSVSNFCKYFKLNTKKTYVEFLNGIRISFASNKLKNTDDTITEICYESGFRNWANFSRQFKKTQGVSPSEYRRKFKNAV